MKVTPAAPTLKTDRLVLRGWHAEDFAAYAALLADPECARFITRRGRPYSASEAWAEMAFFIGHWQLLGFGMFVVEDRRTGAFVGRVGALQPPGWPGFEIAWALAPEAQGRGYATEAAEAVVTWAREELGVSRIISVIHPENKASQAVAVRLGEQRSDQSFSPFGEPCDIWEMTAPR